MSFSVRSSIASQDALIRRISRPRSIRDHNSATTEAIDVIDARQPAKSVVAVSAHRPSVRSEGLSSWFHDLSARLSKSMSSRSYVRQIGAAIMSPGHSLSKRIDLSYNFG
jgi:hypothetical protein